MKYLTIISLFSSVLMISPALASDSTAVPTPYKIVGPNYFYVSADGGWTTLHTPSQNLPNAPYVIGATNSNHSGGLGVSIGYSRAIIPLFSLGLEAGYDYNGRSKYTQDYSGPGFTNDTIQYVFTSKDFHLLATGKMNFNGGLNVFGKAGMAQVHQTMDGEYGLNAYNPNYIPEGSVDGTRPMVAGGIGYNYKFMDIYAQYSHIFAANESDFSDWINHDGGMSVVSVDAFKLGLAFGVRI